MSEISDRADDLITEFGSASQDCGGPRFESWIGDIRDTARQELADYIASLEAELKAECSADDSGSYDSLIPDEEFDALRKRAEHAETDAVCLRYENAKLKSMVERLIDAGNEVMKCNPEEWPDSCKAWNALVAEWEGWS